MLAGLLALSATGAMACSPRTSRLSETQEPYDVAIEGTYAVEDVAREDDFIIASIKFKVKRYLKWPSRVPRQRVMWGSSMGRDDGYNCPPWFWSKRFRYFTFKRLTDGSFELVGAYSEK